MLEALSREVESGDILENGIVDRLIREKRITRDMGTSLINDTGYAQAVALRLLHAARVVLAEAIHDRVEAARTAETAELAGVDLAEPPKLEEGAIGAGERSDAAP